MKNGNLKISSKALGPSESFTVPCTVEEGETLRVFYKNSGDDCELNIKEGSMTMTRSGESHLEMNFELDKSTICAVLVEGTRGELPCHTKQLAVKQGKKGINIKLNYALMGIPMIMLIDITYTD